MLIQGSLNDVHVVCGQLHGIQDRRTVIPSLVRQVPQSQVFAQVVGYMDQADQRTGMPSHTVVLSSGRLDRLVGIGLTENSVLCCFCFIRLFLNC